MRPRCVGSVKHGVEGRRRKSGVGHGERRLAVGLIVVVIAVLVAAANASASPLTIREVVTGDLPQLDIGGLRSLSAGASGAFTTLPALPSAKGNGDIFYSGFEGASPPWYTTGNPTWAGTTYRAAAGSRSAYCAASAVAPPGPYVNGMVSGLFTDPLNLAGVTAATFAYSLYLDTEKDHDYLVVLVSNDDDLATYGGWAYHGISQGWLPYFIDLTDVPDLGNVCGKTNVRLYFIFTSDASTTREGAYVDEVRVSGGQVAPTTAITSLTPNHGQTGATVVIAGTNLGTSGVVRFGSTTATTSAWSATSITCTVPAGLATGAVNVTVTPSGGAASNARSFTVDAPQASKPIEWTISGQPLTVGYNGTVTVSGQLSDATSGAPLSNRSADLCWTEDPSTPIWLWDTLGSYDSATGQFAVRVSGLQRRTHFYLWFNGDSQYEAGFSDQIKVMTRAKLSSPGFSSSVRRGVKVTAWGTIWPQHSAAANQQSHTKISFYCYSNGKWRSINTLWAKSYRNTMTATKYRVVAIFRAAGKYRACAVHQDADHAKTTSSWRYFRVL